MTETTINKELLAMELRIAKQFGETIDNEWNEFVSRCITGEVVADSEEYDAAVKPTVERFIRMIEDIASSFMYGESNMVYQEYLSIRQNYVHPDKYLDMRLIHARHCVQFLSELI